MALIALLNINRNTDPKNYFDALDSFASNCKATYLIIKRIEKAKCLLKKGLTIVDASLSCGFFDQSHFHKYFRRYVGLTPAQYLKTCNILQD